MLILSFFGALDALDFAHLIRSREVKIWNLEGWPYEYGPYRRSEAPVRFYIAIAVNSFFVLLFAILFKQSSINKKFGLSLSLFQSILEKGKITAEILVS